MTCFGALFYLNETACFVQNDAVSFYFFLRRRPERCRFERHCSSIFLPLTCNRGRKKGFAFLPLSLPCATPHTPHDEKPREPRLASHAHWLPRLVLRQGKLASPPTHSDRDALKPRPVYSINTALKTSFQEERERTGGTRRERPKRKE